MRWKGGLISLLIHGAVVLAVTATASERRTRRAATTVSVHAAPPKKEEKKDQPPPTPPPKPPAPKPKAQPVAPEREVPVKAEPAAATPAQNVVDLGLMLSSDAPSGVGVAVPVAGGPKQAQGASSETPKPKAVRADARKRIDRAEQACDEAPTKPAPLDKVEIEYPTSARESGIEGRLVLRVHVGPDGSVENVEVLSGLGPLVDPIAIEAVRRWRFTPAMQCGKAVSGVYTLARRFELGD